MQKEFPKSIEGKVQEQLERKINKDGRAKHIMSRVGQTHLDKVLLDAGLSNVDVGVAEKEVGIGVARDLDVCLGSDDVPQLAVDQVVERVNVLLYKASNLGKRGGWVRDEIFLIWEFDSQNSPLQTRPLVAHRTTRIDGVVHQGAPPEKDGKGFLRKVMSTCGRCLFLDSVLKCKRLRCRHTWRRGPQNWTTTGLF